MGGGRTAPAAAGMLLGNSCQSSWQSRAQLHVPNVTAHWHSDLATRG